MVEVQNAIKRSEAKLPSEVQRTGIEVRKHTGDLLAMFQLMTDGSHMSDLELNNYASTTIADAISRIDGVSAADAFGGKTFSMRIWTDPIRMGGLGISTDDIKNAVESQNLQAAAGLVGAEGGNDFLQFKVDIKGRLKTAEEFENIIVKNDDDGNIVRLKDIARIELGAESYGASCSFNGKSSVGLGVFKTTDANALNTVNAVKKELERLSRNFPEGVSWEIAYDPTKFIEISMREIVATPILGALAGLLITGESFSIYAQLGMVMLVGLTAKNAILMVEFSKQEREMGVPIYNAAVNGASQRFRAVMMTALSFVFGVLPLVVATGAGAASRRAIGITTFSGMLMATCLGIILTPCLYALVQTIRESFNGKIGIKTR